jgi:hypothetical protein
VSVTPAAVEVLRALVRVLPRYGDWYLFGAQAVLAYGVPRLSADVDVTLRLLPDVPDRLVEDIKDIDDARGILKARSSEIDEARIESVLRLLEETLGQSDLLPAWNAIRARR